MNSEFKANGKAYALMVGLRDRIKPDWREMLNPAKEREFTLNPFDYLPSLHWAEKILYDYGISLVDKRILEVGCNEGARSYLMARYAKTSVHGIDVDDYTVAQSPDMNLWNPDDVTFVNQKFTSMRQVLGDKFDGVVRHKVSFETSDIAKYESKEPYDMVVSWDSIEHIIDLQEAFKRMAACLRPKGVSFHEYNSFFSITGGHSLCTTDIMYGHCRFNKEDFERYVQEFRPNEEKIDMNFYNRCLNRATISDVRKYAEDAGFQVLQLTGLCSVQNTKNWEKKVETDYLPDVKAIYPNVTLEDLLWDSIQLVLRKK